MGLSCLINRFDPIVIDTSCAINLNASGAAEAIIRALPNSIIVTDVVLDELREDVRTGRRDRSMTDTLIQKGLIYVGKLTSAEELEFEGLVVGDGIATLDDGEAATIAACSNGNRIAILDERKGRRIALERYSRNMISGSTCDLFSHPAVLSSIGREFLATALLNALRDARMALASDHLDWAFNLIGADVAQSIPSLQRMIKGR